MKFGILTSGGDTPGMNSVIRAAYIHSKNLGHELVGIRHGWKGLLENITMEIPPTIIDQVTLGGTVLGSSRINPYTLENGLEKIRKTITQNNFDCVIVIGGEDTLGVANKLTTNGFNMIGVPKTIDNDLDATDYTFGFNTAITIATEAIDRLHTTAKSHERIIVVEIMGRHAGWMTLHSGIAGGAHVILIPEYPIALSKILQIIQTRFNQGNKWAIIAVSEGFGFSENSNVGEKDEFGHVQLENQEIGKSLAKTLEQNLGISTRSVVLGHTQRGGSPSAFDRVLTTQLGLAAISLAHNNNYGMMPALQGTKIVPVMLSQAIAKLKTVDEESWNFALNLMNIEN